MEEEIQHDSVCCQTAYRFTDCVTSVCMSVSVVAWPLSPPLPGPAHCCIFCLIDDLGTYLPCLRLLRWDCLVVPKLFGLHNTPLRDLTCPLTLLYLACPVCYIFAKETVSVCIYLVYKPLCKYLTVASGRRTTVSIMFKGLKPLQKGPTLKADSL